MPSKMSRPAVLRIIIQVRLMTAKAQNIEAAESTWAGLDSLRYNR